MRLKFVVAVVSLSGFGFIGCSYAVVIGCKFIWVVVMVKL